MTISPEKLAKAMTDLTILDNANRNGRWHDCTAQRLQTFGISDKWKAPTTWFVVDASKAEPEVNYPGELISEHNSIEEARIGLASALIARSEGDQ